MTKCYWHGKYTERECPFCRWEITKEELQEILNEHTKKEEQK